MQIMPSNWKVIIVNTGGIIRRNRQKMCFCRKMVGECSRWVARERPLRRKCWRRLKRTGAWSRATRLICWLRRIKRSFTATSCLYHRTITLKRAAPWHLANNSTSHKGGGKRVKWWERLRIVVRWISSLYYRLQINKLVRRWTSRVTYLWKSANEGALCRHHM